MKVCLSMIVKDEAHVIARCLESCKPHIDYWCIVDTGSTEETVAIIEATMQGIPGEIHHRPWVDFSTNRNQAMELAYPHASYLLFLDADETFVGPALRRDLSGDAFYLPVDYSGVNYQRCALVSTKLQWRYVSPIHEYLESSTPATIGALDSPRIFVRHDGARARDDRTYLKDIEVLRDALAQEPDNQRYAFYLAQSYKDAGMLQEARAMYLRRAGMPGWVQETYMAMYEYAKLTERLNHSPAKAYLQAFQFLPTRAEALYALGRYHRLQGEFALAYVYLKHATTIQPPGDGLFVETAVYDWATWDELGIACYYLGKKQEGREAVLQAKIRAPAREQARLQTNEDFCAA